MSDRGRGGPRGRGRGGRGRGDVAHREPDAQSAPRGGFQGGDRGGSRGANRGSGGQRGFSVRGQDARGGQRGGFHGGDRGGDRGVARGGIGGRGRGHSIFRQNGNIHNPSQSITTLEDAAFEDSLETNFKKLDISKEVKGPRRPAYGTKGRQTIFWANYFEMKLDLHQSFHWYDISASPVGKGDDPKGRKLERIVDLMRPQLPQTIFCATDFRKVVIAKDGLGFTKKEYVVTYVPETETTSTNRSPKFRVKLQYVRSFQLGDFLRYLSDTGANDAMNTDRSLILQALNIVLHHGSKEDPQSITKSNKTFPYEGIAMERAQLRNALEAYRGFFASIRPATGRLLLNLQVQHLAVWEARPMTAVFAKLRNERMSDGAISRHVAGLWIHAHHLRGRPLRRVAGLVKGYEGRGDDHPPQGLRPGATASQVRFWQAEASPPGYVSVADHFLQKYRITCGELPLLNVGTIKRPVFLPPEVCVVMKKQAFPGFLPSESTREMIQFAVRPSPANAATITENGLQLLNKNASNTMEKFGISVDQALITVQGRMLPGYAPTYRGMTAPVRDASWNLVNVKFNKGAQLPLWSWLWLVDGHSGGAFQSTADVNTCVAKLTSMMRTCGINLNDPIPGRRLEIGNMNDPGPEIDTCFKQAAAKQIRLLLVLLPYQHTGLYNAIKKAGDIKAGIHTVGCISDSRKFARGMQDPNSMYLANVSLKFNLKLGGQNHLLRSTDLSFLSEGTCMVAGADVTHPSPGSRDSAPSIAAMTASIDKNLAQWPADIRIQKGKQEMIGALREMMKGRLQLWKKHNSGRLPEEILMYRDGVSESQYDQVRDIELPSIRAACKELYPATDTKAGKPYISIVICGKRHHTRFYPTKEEDKDPRSGGIRPGAIVDRSITEGRLWDFYLTAHNALQGTPKPCHYVVLHDEIIRRRIALKPSHDIRTPGQRAADELESLTHALCYTFQRATKAVSLCPPAYYADLVCDRARRWLSAQYDARTTVSSESGGEATMADVTVHPNLRDSMFYI